MGRINHSEVAKLFRRGGDIYRHMDRIGAKAEATVMRYNPVDTGRSRSSWQIDVKTDRTTIVYTLFNNVYYTGFIRRRGTNEPRGAFICQAARVALAPLTVKCKL